MCCNEHPDKKLQYKHMWHPFNYANGGAAVCNTADVYVKFDSTSTGDIDPGTMSARARTKVPGSSWPAGG